MLDKIIDAIRKGQVATTLTQLTKVQVEAIINKFDEYYHDLNKPLVSDAIYDAVRNYYKIKYPKGKLNKKVGGNRRDTPLPVPMSSLNQFAVGSPKIARFFAQHKANVVSDKHDGLSLEVVYSSLGNVSSAFLRGDAETGTEVSRHLPALAHTIPVRATPNLVVRGEIAIPLATFTKHMHKDNGGDYKAARNAAAGLMNKGEADINFKHLVFSAFAAVGGDLSRVVPSKQLSTLKSLGFTVIPHKLYLDLTEAKLQELLESRLQKSKTEIDGLVIVANTPEPATASNPKLAFKYKMNAESNTIIVPVTDVVYQVTKTGKAQPVVEFEPTTVKGGATIQRANGHNAFYILNGYLKDAKTVKDKTPKPIGVGAMIKVIRSGDVIPYILEVIKPARKPKLPPMDCEYDGLNFIVKDKGVDDIKIRIMLQTLRALNVKDAGPAICKLLVEQGFDVVDLFNATAKSYEFVGVAASKALHKEIQKCKSGVTLAVALHATGQTYCDGAALSTWSDVVNSVGAKVPLDLKAVTTETLASVSIKKLAPNIIKALPRLAKMIKAMGLTITQPRVVRGGKLSGKKITFTGTRDPSLFEAATNAGATIQNYKKDTDILVAKDTGSGSSKLTKAEADGVQILSIEQFRKLL
jgi:DNA ligase (NAD+)